MVRERDSGYALVAAVCAITAFSYIAFQVLAANEGGTAIVAGEVEQAKLAAAADAGISLALSGLAADDRGARWSIDGRPHRLEFNGMDLTVTVEDERGKAPLAQLSDNQARALFAGAGASGDKLDALVVEFHDWQADEAAGDVLEGAAGSGAADQVVRHGAFRTVGELAALKDMAPTIFARIAPAVTVFFGDSGAFEPDHARPLAKAAMLADDLANPEQLDEAARTDSQRPEEELAPDDHYFGRTLTIHVVARDRDGARTHRMEIVELTGDKATPYWVRYSE
jgi:general secretion pathway protein K